MDSDNIMLLKNNIIKIIKNDKKTKNVIECWEGDRLKIFNIDKISHKYSNTKVPLYRFFYNSDIENIETRSNNKENIITRNNYYNIIYKCISCNAVHNVSLNNILRKINKNIINCRICKECDIFKREKQSEFMSNHYYNLKNNIHTIDKVIKKPSLLEKINNDKIEFEKYETEFKENYFRRNMDKKEFDYIKNKIISIQNKKFIMSDDFIYFPCISISNQTRFCPYLYSKTNNNIEKIVNLEFKCENCNSIFFSKDLHTHKNKIKIFCRDCNLCNNVFKIRSYKNLSNENILYQSKFELKFIRYCNENKIYLINGPKVEYFSELRNKQCIYRVDFAIPKLNLLIEIKDNHIWHRDQMSSGKWDEKVNGVKQFIDNKILYNNVIYTKYIIIFPKNYIQECKNIIDKYWVFGNI